MIEYIKHLNEYLNYKHSSFSKLIPPELWGNKQVAEKYLEKYWLPKKEYFQVWKPIQDKIFVQGKNLPDLIYYSKFEIAALNGGCLFLEEDFLQFRKTLQDIGQEYFVVIQHSQEFTEGEPMFRMKFPVSITWEELTDGNYISAVLLEMNYNNYYVFSENGIFGKYSANDYEYPMDIYGYKTELSKTFHKYFTQSIEEEKKIKECLPLQYREQKE